MTDLSGIPPAANLTPEQQASLRSVQAGNVEAALAAQAARPGWRTTEFWVTLFVAAAGVLTNVYSTKPWAQVAGAVAAALVSMGYVSGRSKVKAAP